MTGGHDVPLGGCQVAHARAKTWLSNDQLRDAQEKQTVPLATLPDDEPLGASLLLPAPVQLAGRAVSARLRDCVEAERLPRDLTPERHDLVIRTLAKEIVAADGPS